MAAASIGPQSRRSRICSGSVRLPVRRRTQRRAKRAVPSSSSLRTSTAIVSPGTGLKRLVPPTAVTKGPGQRGRGQVRPGRQQLGIEGGILKDAGQHVRCHPQHPRQFEDIGEGTVRGHVPQAGCRVVPPLRPVETPKVVRVAPIGDRRRQGRGPPIVKAGGAKQGGDGRLVARVEIDLSRFGADTDHDRPRSPILQAACRGKGRVQRPGTFQQQEGRLPESALQFGLGPYKLARPAGMQHRRPRYVENGHRQQGEDGQHRDDRQQGNPPVPPLFRPAHRSHPSSRGTTWHADGWDRGRRTTASTPPPRAIKSGRGQSACQCVDHRPGAMPSAR